jgi:TolB-like protein/DNA-binding winged helix-turn-helix (wHTH) protein/tetratricopeptide (TPR) repeat protein
MESVPPKSHRFSFDNFEVDLQSGELRKNGRKIRLQGQPFQLLAILLERPGEVVTREEVSRRLWPGNTFVDFDHGLGTAMNKLRDALGDSVEDPRFVETLPRRGYRFIGHIDRNEPQPAAQTSGSSLQRRVLLLFAGLLAAVVLLLFLRMWRRGSTASTSNPPHPIMLAVLPFQNFSGDASQDYFSDGLTEEMITQLGELNGNQLSVIARTSSMAYKNTTKDVGQIGRELGVDYILESSVRRDGDKVRITVQLIRVKNQVQVWANSYDREVTHSIAVQEEVAREVAQQIKVNLGRTEAVQGPLNPVANDAYLKGRYYLNQFTENGFSQAAFYFNQALAADPKFAAAYAGLSESYTFLVITNAIPPQEGWPKVRDAAQKAVELDSALSDGRLNLAHFRMHMWDWKDAEADFQRAIALNPSSERAHRWYAAYLCSLGRHQESVKEITQSRGLDPLSSITNAEVVRELYYGRQYEEAVEEGRKAELVDPEFPRTHFWLGRVYAQLGKNSAALAESERAGPSDSIVRVTEMAYAFARAGKTVQARALVRDLQERSKRGYVPAYDLAVIHLALGENETALQWLQKAYDEHDWALIVLAVEPRLDPLRSDPRFQVLMRKVGLREP